MLRILAVSFLLFLDPSWKADLLRDLNSNNMETRIAAVQVLSTNPEALSDTEVQSAVITLYNRESSDPDWGGKAEFLDFEKYDDALLSAVQSIAAKSGRPDAWKALAEGNYNDDSQFAKWLAQQPGAFPILLQLSVSSALDTAQKNEKNAGPNRNEILRGNITFVLAETCSLAGQHCDQVLPILRTRLADKSDWIKLAAVRGLGLCGTASDVKLLQQMEAGYINDRGWMHFLKTSEEEIKGRETQVKAPGPPARQ